MGVVYRAWDPRLRREVAVKMLHPDALGPRAFAQLRAEAQALARVSHPNVVSVLDVGEARGRVFIAMELVRGTTLRAWIERTNPSPRVILEKFVAVGRGLAAVHAAGLIHRDVKPDNVLIDESERPRVVDFGLTRPAPATMTDSGEGTHSTIRQQPTIAGTPGYISPEQRFGCDVDARADQFSFCVSLVEVLTGRRPEVGPLAKGPPAVRIPGVSRSVARAIRRGLSPRPAERFASLEELLAALSWHPRRRHAWTSVVLVALASLAGSEPESVHPNCAEPELATADDPRPPDITEALVRGEPVHDELDEGYNNAMARREYARALEYAMKRVSVGATTRDKTRWLRAAETAYARIDEPTRTDVAQVELARSRMAGPEAALAHLDAALLALATPEGPAFLRAMANNQKGLRLASLGEADGARAAYLEVIRILRAEEGEDSPYLASPYSNLAQLHRYQGEDEEAGIFYARAWEVRRDRFGDANPRTIESASRLAEWLLDQGSTDAAGVVEAIDLTGASDATVASVECLKGELSRQRGHDSQARRRFESARATGIPLPMCDLGLAALALDEGDVDAADKVMRTAIAEFDHFGEAALLTIGIETRLHLAVGHARVLVEAGRLEEARGVVREGLAKTRPALSSRNRWVREANAVLRSSRFAHSGK